MIKRYGIWIAVVALIAGLLYLIMTPATGKSSDIDNARLVQLQQQGVSVVDVRTPEEFAASHIDGAVNVPMSELTEASKSWNKNAPLIVYCATGARSLNAASFLAAQGFRTVYNLKDGIAAWTGRTVGGAGEASGTLSGRTNVKTDGKPVFIDFAGSS